MKTMLKLENIQFIDEVDTWQRAVEAATMPLVDGGYVERRYIDSIIDNTYKFGPYYVLCEDFALLHAGSDQGVIKKQLAITILRKPIKFKADGVNVRVLVTLAAEDSESHMLALKAISKLFADPSNIQKIVGANSEAEVYELFTSASRE
ncbi:MAG: PTS sugar transporter subunit IIA [Erysipelotrichaceae bacterium]|nr:PTS sugar transporter subunit IIA [Erysipelotrichaceae bacterium]